MSLSHLVQNETFDNNERGLKSQFHSQTPKDVDMQFPLESCFRYATLKISYYSTLDSTLNIKFYPKFLYKEANGNIEDGFGFDDSNVNTPVFSITVTGNEYNLHTFPVMGEYFQIEIISDQNEKHLYMNVALSNYNTNTHIG